MQLFSHGTGKPHSGRRSGNFRVIKFSCFKFSRRNIFVVQENSSTFPGLVIWNETTHAKSTNSYHAAVEELVACKREPNNSVGTYCGSKDR